MEDDNPAGMPATTDPVTPHEPKPWWKAVVALVVIVAMVAAFNASHPKPTKSQLASVNTASVSITKDGFVPATIQVKPGMAVTWTNSDSTSHQVAADPYPTDTSIPGFDNNTLLHSKDSYSFTFTKAGTYTYHDQLKPYALKGVVIVK